jgi:hypothetical protein
MPRSAPNTGLRHVSTDAPVSAANLATRCPCSHTEDVNVWLCPVPVYRSQSSICIFILLTQKAEQLLPDSKDCDQDLIYSVLSRLTRGVDPIIIFAPGSAVISPPWDGHNYQYSQYSVWKSANTFKSHSDLSSVPCRFGDSLIAKKDR